MSEPRATSSRNARATSSEFASQLRGRPRFVSASRRIGENSPGCEKPGLKRSRIMSVGILANNMIALQYAIKDILQTAPSRGS
jgi:hypothetical protein